jgi:hypothetical protein
MRHTQKRRALILAQFAWVSEEYEEIVMGIVMA